MLTGAPKLAGECFDESTLRLPVSPTSSGQANATVLRRSGL
jgi:hypothetical protein